jgi:hypothetical protein
MKYFLIISRGGVQESGLTGVKTLCYISRVVRTLAKG